MARRAAPLAALVGADLRPGIAVREGQRVKAGDLLGLELASRAPLQLWKQIPEPIRRRVAIATVPFRGDDGEGYFDLQLVFAGAANAAGGRTP